MASAPSQAEPVKLAMMTVNIKIEQPDIILVESLEQKKCDALVLNVSDYIIYFRCIRGFTRCLR